MATTQRNIASSSPCAVHHFCVRFSHCALHVMDRLDGWFAADSVMIHLSLHSSGQIPFADWSLENILHKGTCCKFWLACLVEQCPMLLTPKLRHILNLKNCEPEVSWWCMCHLKHHWHQPWCWQLSSSLCWNFVSGKGFQTHALNQPRSHSFNTW